MKIIWICFSLFFMTGINGQILVNKNHRFLQDKSGKPFFWLADTDWELFHRLTREEAGILIKTRSSQGFNVLQAVALAEFNGLHQPNRYGDIPLIHDDPTHLNITPGNDPSDSIAYDYWDHLDYIIQLAANYKMYIGLVPTWGDKVAHLWGDGPIIFNESNAKAYASTLAKRYKNQWNIIWILGGDRPPGKYTGNDQVEYDHRPVWRAMANAILKEIPNAFITYHPSGGKSNATSTALQNESWLDLNAFQSGHGSREADSWNWTRSDLSLTPPKPTLDMEVCYEDHPVNPWDGKWTRARGYFHAYDVRARMYRGIFAGQCGVTYGHHHVWQFMNANLNPAINTGDTIIPWQNAIRSEAATQVIHLKNLITSRPYFDRVNDTSLIVSKIGNTYKDRLECIRAQDKSFAMIYSPTPSPVQVDLNKISGNKKVGWYYDVKSGEATRIPMNYHQGIYEFVAPKNVMDWVLVIDNMEKKYRKPGSIY